MSVVLLSEIVAVDVSEKLQLGMPGMLPEPEAEIFSVVLLASVPEPEPLIIDSPPSHDTVNVPAIDVVVCEVTVQTKLPHDLGSGIAGTDAGAWDDHAPTIAAVTCEEPPPEVALDGAVTLDWCWKPHAAANTVAASRTIRDARLFMLALIGGGDTPAMLRHYTLVPGRTDPCAFSPKNPRNSA